MPKKDHDLRECCPACGSDAIEIEGWIDVNEDVSDGYTEGADEPYYCQACNEHFRTPVTRRISTGEVVGDPHEFAEGPVPLNADHINVDRVKTALVLLQQARDLFVAAGSPKAAERVRLAISSARGAVYNARLRANVPRKRKRIRRAPKIAVVRR